ncbi:hypothetical protein MLD38_005387 [Melastoma candidum]|uniref:Uncharacterized protein n=1 Tax=Melastoma candidum TaxID=119954 RepID=A0ACB9SAL8_9MYRT|nr:hypothetical protein MLD38_005387 [Melastoma candidum]
MASLKAEKPAGSGAHLPGQAKQDPLKAAATPAAAKAPAAATLAAAKAPAAAAAKPAAPKKAEPKPTSQPKKKAPTAGKK